VSRTIHCGVSVRGALLAPYAQQRRVASTLLRGGVPCRSVQEYREALADLLVQGVEMLPIGEPCEGWDRKTGCPGHEKAAP
jgi:hypothetical protein